MKKDQSKAHAPYALPEGLTQAALHSAQALPPLPDLEFPEGEGGSMDIQSWECLGLGELSYFEIVYIWNLPDLWSQKKHPHVGNSSELFTVGVFLHPLQLFLLGWKKNLLVISHNL